MSHLRLPPRHGNLLVPIDDQASFRAGLALWSPSRRGARALQRLYWAAASVVGPENIPGPRGRFESPMPEATLKDHDLSWRSWFGSYDQAAVYRPAQTNRPGFALLLLDRGRPRGFVKCRPHSDPHKELSVVARMAGAATFTVPEIVGHCKSDGWTSVGAVPVPVGLYSPLIRVPVSEIAAEVSERLGPEFDPPRDGWRPMHGDLGPWNLRQLPGRKPVLYDWEHATHGPPNADLVFHSVASRVLGLPMSADIASMPEAIGYWKHEIPRRFGDDRRDARLAGAMLETLIRYT